MRRHTLPHRDLIPSSPCSAHQNRSRHMLDLAYLGLGLGSFALMAGYVALCRKL
jgi:hypothetical protein